MNKKILIQIAFVLLTLFTLSPAWAATITVNSLGDAAADDGECTLREAIVSANTNAVSGATGEECAAGEASPVLDVIEFSVAGTIQPATQLPLITTAIHINGYSAPGASKNTLPLAQGTNAVLTIEIDSNGNNWATLFLSGPGASGSIIEGLVLGASIASAGCCAQNGIFANSVSGAATTIIRGNFVGTDITGTAGAGHAYRGVAVWNGSSNIVIGSGPDGEVDPGAVNVLSGNGSQNLSLANISDFTVRGNLIGTKASGAENLLNSSSGLGIDNGTSGQVLENVISGSNGAGISIRQESSGLLISQNLIGLNAAGTGPLPNKFAGILIAESIGGAGKNIVNLDIVENTIAYNTCNSCSGGIIIGRQTSSNNVRGIRLSKNLIYSNSSLQLDLAETNGTDNGLVYGVTDNDAGDPDDGANNLQNFPVISSASADGVTILANWTLDSDASKAFTLEFFHTATCDSSNHGGAEIYLGDVGANTDGSGLDSGVANLPSNITSGFITATATNVENGTSEFSACVALSSEVVFDDGFETPPP